MVPEVWTPATMRAWTRMSLASTGKSITSLVVNVLPLTVVLVSRMGDSALTVTDSADPPIC